MIEFASLTLQDALDLAILIEEEAEERYREFNRMLGERYEGDAATFFNSMAENEAKHGRDLSRLRTSLFKESPRRITRTMFTDVEAPDYGMPRQYMSPRQAMNVALESEIKAFHFFDEALKSIHDPLVKALFEELRDEEVEHQRLVNEFLMKMSPGEGPDNTLDKTDEDLDETPGLD